MNINRNDTAVVVIDPQNDVLSEKGVSWDLVGALILPAFLLKLWWRVPMWQTQCETVPLMGLKLIHPPLI